MKIYTSSWFTPLPPTIQKIGISRGTPRGYPAGYRKMGELCPGEWFKTVSPLEYDRRFQQVLAALDPQAILSKITELAAGKDVALLCYEDPKKAGDWCHRGQVSAWLKDTLGLDVFEYGLEELGCGHSHPKLFSELRR